MSYLVASAPGRFPNLSKLNKRTTVRSIVFALYRNSFQTFKSSRSLSNSHQAAKYSTKENPLSQIQTQTCSPLRSKNAPIESSRAARAEYELTYTCNSCQARSTHRISKQGYHHGSVLVACPGCKNRHVISDNLKVFGDRDLTIEDLMREQGQFVKKGTLTGVRVFESLFGNKFERKVTEK